MEQSSNDKVKIRFKFRSGEEFEAEGSPDFIDKQRSDFLQLIGKDGRKTSRVPAVAASATHLVETDPTISYTPSVEESAGSGSAAWPHHWPTAEGGNQPTALPPINTTISAAERAAKRVAPSSTQSMPDVRLWEEIVRVEDNMVFLRRKNRLLTSDTAALVLLAAAKVLLGLPDGYSALALSKSLKKSGYGGERLDRVLGGEMKMGTVRSVGSKRSRLYLLSDEGFAKAYVLAGKLTQNP
ncbi:MAG: hypothetical protein IKN49_05185 [Elusimicrobiaceae bacterium]|nr:hypothetical protein [Elusimicrobiaceae bacterium]